LSFQLPVLVDEGEPVADLDAADRFAIVRADIRDCAAVPVLAAPVCPVEPSVVCEPSEVPPHVASVNLRDGLIFGQVCFDHVALRVAAFGVDVQQQVGA